MSDKPDKSAKALFAQQLAEWRRERFDEMEENLRVWKTIRDDPDQSARDRNEACKNIAKALGGLAQERTAPAPPPKPAESSEEKEAGFKLSEEEMAEIHDYLKS